MVNLIKLEDVIQAQETSIKPHFKRLRPDSDGLMKIKIHGIKRIWIPDSLKFCILENGHDNANHPGLRKTRANITPNYWWFTINEDIKAYVQSCHTCQMTKYTDPHYTGQLHPITAPKAPMDLIYLSTIRFDKPSAGSPKYIHIVMDLFTRFVWIRAMTANTTQTAIIVLDPIFRSFGTAKRLLTDNFSCFKGRAFQRFLIENQCLHLVKTLYTNDNGTSEKNIITQQLRTALQSNEEFNWAKLLSNVVNTYNNTTNRNTGFTPTFLLFGEDSSQKSFLSLEEARLAARYKADMQEKDDEKVYDEVYQALMLKVGDLVKRRITNRRSDMRAPMYDGPFCVMEVLGPTKAQITDFNVNSTTQLVRICHLAPYHLRKL